jgi:hypothetical protein
MVYLSGFALCAAITSATPLQIPLLSSSKQAPLGHPNGTKRMVNSTELQGLISGDRLMVRAKKMFEIAKLGEEEYNHPTRVIGSLVCLCTCFCSAICWQAYRPPRDAIIHLRDHPPARRLLHHLEPVIPCCFWKCVRVASRHRRRCAQVCSTHGPNCRPWGLPHGPVLFAPGSTACLLSRTSPLGLVRAPFST